MRRRPTPPTADRESSLLHGHFLDLRQGERVRPRAHHLEGPVGGRGGGNDVCFLGGPVDRHTQRPLARLADCDKPIGSNGVNVCPTDVTTTTPIPAPAAVRRPRRDSPGVTGGGTGPAMLWDSGFRSMATR